MRPETGSMQFGDDWSGVFVRGSSNQYMKSDDRQFMKKFEECKK